MPQPVLLIHGGAGDITDSRVSGKLEGMKSALYKAYPLLLSKVHSATANSTPALDAVEAAVRSMELDENFNAGYGACLNYNGNILRSSSSRNDSLVYKAA